MSIFSLRDGDQARIAANEQVVNAQLRRLYRAGLHSHEVAACAHDILIACRQGEQPLEQARHCLSRLGARAAARAGKSLPIADLLHAFSDWIQCNPYEAEEYDELVKQHCIQQLPKKLQELTSADHFPFGSWVCARCERVNASKINPCPTLEMALCYDSTADGGQYKVFSDATEISGSSIEAALLLEDQPIVLNRAARTISELKRESRERGAVSDAESRGAASLSPERQAEVSETLVIKADVRRIRKTADKFQHHKKTNVLLGDQGRWACPTCKP